MEWARVDSRRDCAFDASLQIRKYYLVESGAVQEFRHLCAAIEMPKRLVGFLLVPQDTLPSQEARDIGDLNIDSVFAV